MARFKDHFGIAVAAFEKQNKQTDKLGYLPKRELSLAEQLLEFGNAEEKLMAMIYLNSKKK
jgi:hypothetical protein